MAFLDFVKNREGQRPAAEQQSQQQKPTPDKQPARSASEIDPPQKSVAEIPDAAKERARDAGSRVEQVGQNVSQSAPANTPAPGGDASTPEAMRQDMTGTNKSQPALSPTDGQVANTSLEQDKASSPSKTTEQQRDSSSPSPMQTPNSPQRDRGGWER